MIYQYIITGILITAAIYFLGKKIFLTFSGNKSPGGCDKCGAMDSDTHAKRLK